VTHTTSAVPEISVLTNAVASAAPAAHSLSANGKLCGCCGKTTFKLHPQSLGFMNAGRPTERE
jgi:hypothetical protein